MKNKIYRQKVELPDFDYKKILFYSVIIFLSYVFVSNAIIKYFVVKQKYNELEKKYILLKRKNFDLRQELNLIKNDSSTIEYYVRKELGYIKQGEQIYILKNEQHDVKEKIDDKKY